MKILITSGGTKVKIDSVRHIGNLSSGRFGSELAIAALEAGHQVCFLHAKGSIVPHVVPVNLLSGDMGMLEQQRSLIDRYVFFSQVLNEHRYMHQEYSDFTEYQRRLGEFIIPTYQMGNYDIVLLAAAVSDYGVISCPGKISSDLDEVSIKLHKLPKVLKGIKAVNPKIFQVGFKLLVDSSVKELVAAAQRQIAESNSDLVVANLLHEVGRAVYLISKDRVQCVTEPMLAKKVIDGIIHEKTWIAPVNPDKG